LGTYRSFTFLAPWTIRGDMVDSNLWNIFVAIIKSLS
jgi:hypothetical protein